MGFLHAWPFSFLPKTLLAPWAFAMLRITGAGGRGKELALFKVMKRRLKGHL